MYLLPIFSMSNTVNKIKSVLRTPPNSRNRFNNGITQTLVIVPTAYIFHSSDSR